MADQTDPFSREHAVLLDSRDSLKHMNKEFLIPSKANLRTEILSGRS